MRVAGPRQRCRHAKNLVGVPREIVQAAIAGHAEIYGPKSRRGKGGNRSRADIQYVDPVVDVIGEEIVARVLGGELLHGLAVKGPTGNRKALERAAAVGVGIDGRGVGAGTAGG